MAPRKIVDYEKINAAMYMTGAFYKDLSGAQSILPNFIYVNDKLEMNGAGRTSGRASLDIFK